MADITNQADLNSHEIGTTLVYVPGGLTPENLNFNTTATVTITAPDNSAIAVTDMTSTATSTGVTFDAGTGGEVVITDEARNGDQMWRAGTFQADGKVIVHNHTTFSGPGGSQWPGFTANTPYNMVIPNCEIKAWT